MTESGSRGALQLLELQCDASDDDVRNAIKQQIRKWRKRTNAPKLAARQEAERMIEAIASAETLLLSSDGQAFRRRASQPGASVAYDSLEAVDAESVAEMISRILTASGTRSQQRRRTVVHRRSRLFHKGVEYVLEEMVHKSYESQKDKRRFVATQAGMPLFEHIIGGPAGDTTVTGAYIEGPWVGDLMELDRVVREPES